MVVVLLVWAVVAAAVLALLLVPYQTQKNFTVSVRGKQIGVGNHPPKVGPNGSLVPDTFPIYEYANKDVTVQLDCRAPISEQFTEVSDQRIANAVQSVSGEQPPVSEVAPRMKTSCQGSATPRLLIAGGILLAALIGTWLYFNLTRSQRESSRMA